MKKRSDNVLEICVDSENRQSHIIYSVDKLHHFEEYLNGKLIQEYFRDDSGTIININTEKNIETSDSHK